MTDALPGLLLIGLFLLAFLTVAGLVLLVAIKTLGKVGKHGSIAGALYQGRVAQTYGKLEVAPRGIAKVTLGVVGVEGEPPAVGIEVHVNARLGYSMRAVRLTADEALRVADALEAAASR
jgi:hypothetical protein